MTTALSCAWRSPTGTSAALFSLTDPGDEVVLTDPTYAGMLNRVRLVGAVPSGFGEVRARMALSPA